MQRQLNNFSPSLKVNLTRTRQGPVSMILNINNGNVAWKRISTSPDFSERTEEKCSNKINEESKAFFHINTGRTSYFIILLGQGLLKPHLEWDSVFIFMRRNITRGSKGPPEKSSSDILLMRHPRPTRTLNFNENECVRPDKDLYHRCLYYFLFKM